MHDLAAGASARGRRLKFLECASGSPAPVPPDHPGEARERRREPVACSVEEDVCAICDGELRSAALPLHVGVAPERPPPAAPPAAASCSEAAAGGPALHTCATCRNAMHEVCWELWVDKQLRGGTAPTCPLCRAETV